MTEAETGKRPKPIELVARAIAEEFDVVLEEVPNTEFMAIMDAAKAAFSILTKHGCISIEGIIARDEEMGTDVRKT